MNSDSLWVKTKLGRLVNLANVTCIEVKKRNRPATGDATMQQCRVVAFGNSGREDDFWPLSDFVDEDAAAKLMDQLQLRLSEHHGMTVQL